MPKTTIQEMMERRGEVSFQIQDLQHEKKSIEVDLTRKLLDSGDHQFLNVNWRLLGKALHKGYFDGKD